jgi:hypothetical protein
MPLSTLQTSRMDQSSQLRFYYCSLGPTMLAYCWINSSLLSRVFFEYGSLPFPTNQLFLKSFLDQSPIPLESFLGLIGIPKYLNGKSSSLHPKSRIYSSVLFFVSPKQNSSLLWKLIFRPETARWTNHPPLREAPDRQ